MLKPSSSAGFYFPWLVYSSKLPQQNKGFESPGQNPPQGSQHDIAEGMKNRMLENANDYSSASN
ncbi:hypothetical protein DRO66_04630 [Candidatus Bathyarchaeota archaeon]|nr:MAG: hypothetical protein DRO66_04630 [Candidatus Bathyarchaeota archaeon]